MNKTPPIEKVTGGCRGEAQTSSSRQPPAILSYDSHGILTIFNGYGVSVLQSVQRNLQDLTGGGAHDIDTGSAF